MCILCYLELRACGFKRFSYYCLFALVFNIIVSISTRGHYIIDLCFGIFFAHYLWIIGGRLSYLIDFKIMNMKFEERFPLFQKRCGHC